MLRRAVPSLLAFAMAGGLVAAPVWAGVVGTAREEALRLLSVTPDRNGAIVTRDGTLLAMLRGDEYRLPLSPADVPLSVRRTLLATEDRRFESHNGVDPRGLVRAVWSTLTSRGVQGGSTLTQQLVKNLRALNSASSKAAASATARTAGRKLTEAVVAIEMEKRLTKDEILLRYLDTAYFGNGAWGLTAAADRYFSTRPSELTWPQAALLVGMLQNPTRYDPFRNPRDARARRDLVLSLTARVFPGDLPLDELKVVTRTDVSLKAHRPLSGCAASTEPIVCRWVIDELLADPRLGESDEERRRVVFTGGIRVSTLLDTDLQSKAQLALKRLPGGLPTLGAAAAVVEPGTGRVLAMVQRSTPASEINLADPFGRGGSGRQPGSTYKLFTLLAALEEGYSLDDGFYVPSCYRSVVFANPDNRCFSNYEPSESGWFSMRTATAYSVNTFFVKLGEKVGIERIVDTAARLGVKARSKPGPQDGSVILGALEVSPLAMAAAYATVASGGVYCQPRLVDSVTLADGSVLPFESRCRRVLSPQVAARAADALGAVVEYGTGVGARVAGLRVAGKTGTTDGSGDTWFDGFTLRAAVAVWMGDMRGPAHTLNGLGGRRHVYGGTFAAPTAGALLALAEKAQAADSAARPSSVRIPDLKGTYGLTPTEIAALLRQYGLGVRFTPLLGRLEVFPASGRQALPGAVVYVGVGD